MKNTTLSGTMPKKKVIPNFLLANKNTILEIVSALFILLFVYTSLSKFTQFEPFKIVLRDSPLIGNKNIIVAWAIPSIELIVAFLLLIPRTRLLGFYSSFALMTIFTLYLGYMIIFTPLMPCSCGGVIKQMSWNQHLVFNIFFTLLSILGCWLIKKPATKEPAHNTQIVFT
jgi:hypothetical protein